MIWLFVILWVVVCVGTPIFCGAIFRAVFKNVKPGLLAVLAATILFFLTNLVFETQVEGGGFSGMLLRSAETTQQHCMETGVPFSIKPLVGGLLLTSSFFILILFFLAQIGIKLVDKKRNKNPNHRIQAFSLYRCRRQLRETPNVLHQKIKQKLYYECRIVFNPEERGLVADSNIKFARVYSDQIRIGRKEFNFSEMQNRKLENSVIQFSTEQGKFKISHEGYQRKGIPFPKLTELLSTLIDALAGGNDSQAQQIAKALIRIRRMMHVRNLFHVVSVVAYVSITACLFTSFPCLQDTLFKHLVLSLIIGFASIATLSYWTAELATFLVAKNINRCICR
jgi:hypothetical protein